MTLLSNVARRNFVQTTKVKTREVVRSTEVITPSRIVSKNTDGRATVVALDGTCPTRSTAIQSEQIGETIFVPTANFNQTGSTGLGATIVSGNNFGWIEEQIPQIMDIGTTTEITYVGGGFNLTLVIVYLLPRVYWVDPDIPEVHPDITITNLVIVDPQTATADVTVAADAVWELDPATGEPITLGPIDGTLTFV